MLDSFVWGKEVAGKNNCTKMIVFQKKYATHFIEITVDRFHPTGGGKKAVETSLGGQADDLKGVISG